MKDAPTRLTSTMMARTILAHDVPALLAPHHLPIILSSLPTACTALHLVRIVLFISSESSSSSFAAAFFGAEPPAAWGPSKALSMAFMRSVILSRSEEVERPALWRAQNVALVAGVTSHCTLEMSLRELEERRRCLQEWRGRRELTSCCGGERAVVATEIASSPRSLSLAALSRSQDWAGKS